VAIATPESYADMLDRAKAGKYAIPAINVTSSQTLSAALKGFADAESDGIVQISNGGAAYWSGSSRLDRVKGSIAFTAYARAVGDLYPVTIGLHTDHCPKKLLADWIHPLLEIEAEQVKNGELPMFNSHMWDGSAEALDDNIEIAVDMLKRAKAANVVLEIEIGAVGGEEDGIKGEENANLYTTADDAWKAIEAACHRPYRADQALAPLAALRASTRTTLSVGQPADLVLTAGPGKVLLTMLGGRITFSR